MTEQCIYLIRHKSSGLVKIGITENWQRRCSELEVEVKCEVLKVMFCELAHHHEKQMHIEFDDFRLPQSEWFHLNNDQTQSLIEKVSLLGKENKWRPGEKKKQTKRVKKQTLLLPETEIDKWGDLLLSSEFVSTVDLYCDAICAYGLEVERVMLDGYLSQKMVGSISPTSNGVIFCHLQESARIERLEIQKVECKDIFDLLQCIESRQKYLLANNSKLCLPVGTKIKTNFLDGIPNYFLRLHNELESYF